MTNLVKIGLHLAFQLYNILKKIKRLFFKIFRLCQQSDSHKSVSNYLNGAFDRKVLNLLSKKYASFVK